MTIWTLATLHTLGGPKAAIGINGKLFAVAHFITLQPGDILFTGSPSGSAREHGGRWLKPGDRIHAEISEVGVLNVTMRRD